MKQDLEDLKRYFAPLAVYGLRIFTRYLLPPGACSKTTKSNICVDLENFCLEFAVEID